MIELPIWLLLLLVLGIAIAFVVGWNLSVFAFRDHQKAQAKRFLEQAERLEELAKMMDQDPTRAGIDIGKDYVVGLFENFARDLRADLES